MELHHQLFLQIPGWAAGCLSVLQCWQVLLLHYVTNSLCDGKLPQWHTAAANVPVIQVHGAPHVHMVTECCCPWMVLLNWTSAYCKQHTASICVRSFIGQLKRKLSKTLKCDFGFDVFILAGKYCGAEPRSQMNCWAFAIYFFLLVKEKKKIHFY